MGIFRIQYYNTISKIKTISVLSSMVLINIGLIIWLATGITAKADYMIVMINTLILLVAVHILIYYKLPNNYYERSWKVLYGVTLVTICFLVFTQPIFISYYNDCVEISNRNPNVSMTLGECVDYAVNNPGITGAELIEHFEQKTENKIRESNNIDVMQRPLRA